ncbi:MAG: hypothetical protein ACLUW6_04870 [Coriobacteriaceae bacterium]
MPADGADGVGPQAMSVLKLHTMATAIMTKKVTTPNTARSTMSFAVRRLRLPGCRARRLCRCRCHRFNFS